MHGSIWPVTIPPSPPPDNPRYKSSPTDQKLGSCLKRSCPGDRGMEQMKNIFSSILWSTCHVSRGLHDGCGPQDQYFLKRRNFSKSGSRGLGTMHK